MKKIKYEEAVEFCVNWWSNQIMNYYDDGSLDEKMRDICKRDHFDNLLKCGVSDKTIEAFKNEIRKFLMNFESNKGQFTYLSCDNGPSIDMREICNKSGINPLCLPWKSFTEINSDNTVIYKTGYAADVQLFPKLEADT